MVDYVIYEDRVLGYTSDSITVGVLGSKIREGGPDPKNGFIFVTDKTKLRLATRDDFDDYRVVPPSNFR